MRRAALLTFVLACLLAAPRPTGAQPSPLDVARAEALFKEAKALSAEGKFEQACPKLAESYRLDPGGGTALSLGLCYAQIGKTASAYGALSDALRWARRDGRSDREKLAKTELASLEPRLSRVEIRVPAALTSSPGWSVLLDGNPLDATSLGVPLPVDPGSHEVVVVATGARPWRGRVEVGASGDLRSVVVPELEAPASSSPPPAASPPLASASSAPTATPPATASAARPASGSALRTAGLVVGGLGLVGLAAGSYLGLRARSLDRQARQVCPSNRCSDLDGVSKNHDALDSASAASLSFVAGLLGVGAGLALFVLGRDERPSASLRQPTRVGAWIGERGGSLSLEGSF